MHIERCKFELADCIDTQNTESCKLSTVRGRPTCLSAVILTQPRCGHYLHMVSVGFEVALLIGMNAYVYILLKVTLVLALT